MDFIKMHGDAMVLDADQFKMSERKNDLAPEEDGGHRSFKHDLIWLRAKLTPVKLLNKLGK